MIILGANIVVLACALLGGMFNWIIERKINWKNLMSSLWLGGVTFCYWDSPYAYLLSAICGFLACRYVNRLIDYALDRWLKKQKMKRWGKFIHKQ